MDWKAPILQDKGAVLIPKRWLYIHYYEALNILFRTENAMRVFVYIILKDKLGEQWPNAALQTSESEQSTIAKVAAKRVSQARGYGYLGYEIASPLMHLNSGELTRLMMADAYWSHFESYFRAKRQIIQSKLDEVNTVRNALAHFRPIRSEDVELIKQNVRHVFVGIEQCLTEILQTYAVVPTNSAEDWYSKLAALSVDPCKVDLHHSANEQWVRVALMYKPPILSQQFAWKEYKSIKVANLVTPAIPKQFPGLAKHCIFLTEAIQSSGGDNPFFNKVVSIVFSRATLDKNGSEISSELAKVISVVNEETALLTKDHPARGKLVKVVSVSARRQEPGWWSTDTGSMRHAFGETDAPEYWGDLQTPEVGDFISATTQYPWMPVSLAEGESVFD